MKNLKSCKQCGYLTEEPNCSLCNSQTSREWQGYVIIIDHNKSAIAKAVGIETNGKFSLRVR